MVYNAMKLFMEINPQLFDDCSHEYTEHQNNAEARIQARDAKWKTLADQASARKTNGSAGAGGARTKFAATPRLDEIDPAEESQKRMEQLKLVDSRERPTRERQNSAGSGRSQR